ncbi:MAG: TetR/AcrR family transcriptional regulator [Anaerolineaceae bacterium]|nr:TetR/AcrR family transcriptional regulator [Anaerolineaceae bacterium]
MVRTLNPERREKFLNAALALFVEKGVQNTTTAEIAQAAGAAAGTLFLYFPTKQDLIDELALQISRAQTERINSLLDPELSARESFYAIWRGSVGWFVENPLAYRYILQVRDSGMISTEVVKETGLLFNFYYAAIQKGLQEKVIHPYPVDLIGGFLYQNIVAITNYIQMQPDPVRRQEALEMGFDIFWNGICARE